MMIYQEKTRISRGRGVKKGEKFIATWGKNIILKKGGGEYHVLGKYTPLQCDQCH